MKYLVGGAFILFGLFAVISRRANIGEDEPVYTMTGWPAVLVGLFFIIFGLVFIWG